MPKFHDTQQKLYDYGLQSTNPAQYTGCSIKNDLFNQSGEG